MKFVLVASKEYKVAPASLKISYWMMVAISIAILVEVFTSGSLFTIAPELSVGSGIVGFLIAYIAFDTANTLVRKRKTAKFIALLAALASIALSLLVALQSTNYLMLGFMLPGLILLLTLNAKSSRDFFTRKKQSD